jgi:hypothetical protein
MGYITSAITITLDSHLTQKGREGILSGITNNITKFSLGDSDTNYLITTRNSVGKVPDVTGDHIGCVLSVARNIGIKNNISVSGLTIPTTKEVRFVKDNVSYNVLNVEVDLGNYFDYLKFESLTTSFNPQLKSPIIDFYDFIRVEEIDGNGNSVGVENDSVYSQFKTTQDFNVFKKLQNDYLKLSGIGFFNEGFNNIVESPLRFLFSSLNDTYFGSGAGGLLLNGREWGYCVVNLNNLSVPLNWFLFNTSGTLRNFFTIEEVENESLISLGNGLRLVPAIRMMDSTNYGNRLVFPLQNFGTYNDNSGSHDHIKRVSNAISITQFLGSISVINNEVGLGVSTIQSLTSAGFGTIQSGVNKINMGMKFISETYRSQVKFGELNITLKLDNNPSNWNRNNPFITII